MVLAVDVGNTNTVIGVLDGERLVVSGRLSTQPHDTDDDCALRIYSFLRINTKSISTKTVLSTLMIFLFSNMTI